MVPKEIFGRCKSRAPIPPRSIKETKFDSELVLPAHKTQNVCMPEEISGLWLISPS